MENKNRTIEKEVRVLYEQVKKLNAGELHTKVEGINNDPKASAVISVYHEQRPSHEVLDELYEWGEKTGNHVLTDKIESLSVIKTSK